MAFHETINNIPFGGELKSAEINGILNAIHENTLELKNDSTVLSENIDQTVNRSLSLLQDDLSDHKKLTGNENLYGHVKLTDDIDSTAKADEGVGISPFAMAKLRAEMSEKMYSTLPFPAQALIRVTSSAGGAALANIPFTVSENGGADMVYTSNSSGTISVAGVNGDKLVIKPSLTGLLWTSNPTSATLTLATDKTVETAFSLTPIPVGTVKIIAKSSSGALLSGRQFTVTVSGAAAKTMTTDANGEISVSTDPGKTVTAVLKDLGLGASVNQSSSVTTVVGGTTTSTVFILTASIGTELTYTKSETITLDAMITSIDVEGESGSAGGGGAVCGTGNDTGSNAAGNGVPGGAGGNAEKKSALNQFVGASKTLVITIGSYGVGGETTWAASSLWNNGIYLQSTYTAGTYEGKKGTDGGVTSVKLNGVVLLSTVGGGGGIGGKMNIANQFGALDNVTYGVTGSPSGNGQTGGAGSANKGQRGSDGKTGYVKITIRG